MPTSRAKTKKAPKKSLLRDLIWLGAFSATALLTRATFADQYVVPSGSMRPTVHEADRIFVEKAAYGVRIPLSETYVARWESPKAGDVVVLDSPDQDSTVLLKRVVAVAGDVVTVKDGKLSLNGVPMKVESDIETLRGVKHDVSLDMGGGPDFGPEIVPKGKVLVMGDNRGNSRDGRYFGFVSVDAVLGKADRVFLRDGSFTWRKL